MLVVSETEPIRDETKTIRGFSDLRRSGTNASVRTAVPVTLVSYVLLKSSLVVRFLFSSGRPGTASRSVPALLIRTSRTPNSTEMDLSAVVMDSSEVMSSWMGEAEKPFLVRVEATSSAAASLREPMMTW